MQQSIFHVGYFDTDNLKSIIRHEKPILVPHRILLSLVRDEWKLRCAVLMIKQSSSSGKVGPWHLHSVKLF